MRFRSALTAGLLGLRAALGALLAYGIALALELQHPIFALIAAIIVTDFAPSETQRLGYQRLAATLVGAGVSLCLLAMFKPSWWSVCIGIIVAMVLCEVLGVYAGAKLSAYMCALVLLSESAHPFEYVIHRAFETIIGGGVAWVISLVPRFIAIEPPDVGT